MKKICSTLLLCLMTIMASAQTPSHKLKIALTDGTTITYSVDNIDSIWFEEAAAEESTVYKVTIPTEFPDSYVMNIVNDNGTKIGEVCSEYIRSFGNADDKNTVVYSVLKDDDGKYLSKVNMASCLDVTNGATICWDTENDSIASYTPAATNDSIAEVYITADGVILTAAPDGAEVADATLSPRVLLDFRGAEKNTYAIVKIGTQYWMAQNLRACCYNDGTAITCYTSTQLADWKATTSGAYHVFADDTDNIGSMGVMYNGYAMLNENIAPAGWTVPETADYNTMKAYLKSYSGRKLKSDIAYDWNESDYPCTNVTNFGACGDGYFMAATDGDTGYGTDVYYWTKTATYDTLTKSDAYGAMRLNYKSNNLITTGLHEVRYGHYIRCIMK